MVTYLGGSIVSYNLHMMISGEEQNPLKCLSNLEEI